MPAPPPPHIGAANEPINQFTPAVQVIGRRNVCFPPELRSVSAFQAGGKEAQLNERPNVQFKQRIKQLIDVLEIVNLFAIFIFPQYKHIVMQKPVKTKITKANLLLHLLQMLLKACPKALVGAACANAVFPIRSIWGSFLAKINGCHFSSLLIGRFGK